MHTDVEWLLWCWPPCHPEISPSSLLLALLLPDRRPITGSVCHACCSNKWFHTTKTHYHQACPYPLLNPPWLIRNQWSMVNNVNTYFSFNGMKWIRTINILSPQFAAIQHNKWAWTASHPTQLPVQLPSTVPTPPLYSEEHSPFHLYSHCRWARRLEWRRTWSGVGAESQKKRKVGRANGPQVGEKVNTQPMLDDGGAGFCGWDTILIIIFPRKRHFCSRVS